MKLLYITNGINGSGGLERVLSIRIAILIEEYGCEVGILVLNNTHVDPFYDFHTNIQFFSVAVSGNPLVYFQNYKKGIQHAVDEFQPEIISVCDDGLKGFFLPQLIKTDARWVYERHVSKLIEMGAPKSSFRKLITKMKWRVMEYLGNSFSKFIVLTDGNKQEWPKLKNIEVISNPLPFYPESSSTLKNKKVICVGRMCFQKGQKEMLKIWEMVHQDFPEWELHFYGKENLDYLDTRNLTNNTFFHLPEKNIEYQYLESAIYSMPSQFEGFGMVLIEAMACGVPCVSFDCNYGPSDIIDNGENGYLIPLNDLKGFAEKLKCLMGDEEKRMNLGGNAKQSVHRYLPEMILKQWISLYRDILKA